MRYVSGKVLTEEGFIDGHVGFEDGIVMEVAEGDIAGSEASGIVLPTLVNAHTHIADYLVKKCIVENRQEAFDKYLLKCDVPKYPLYLEDASKIVDNAAGTAIMSDDSKLRARNKE